MIDNTDLVKVRKSILGNDINILIPSKYKILLLLSLIKAVKKYKYKTYININLGEQENHYLANIEKEQRKEREKIERKKQKEAEEKIKDKKDLQAFLVPTIILGAVEIIWGIWVGIKFGDIVGFFNFAVTLPICIFLIKNIYKKNAPKDRGKMFD